MDGDHERASMPMGHERLVVTDTNASGTEKCTDRMAYAVNLYRSARAQTY